MVTTFVSIMEQQLAVATCWTEFVGRQHNSFSLCNKFWFYWKSSRKQHCIWFSKYISHKICGWPMAMEAAACVQHSGGR